MIFPGKKIFVLVNRADRLAGYIEYWIEKDKTLYVASIQISPKFRNGAVLRNLLSQAYNKLRKDIPFEASTSVHSNNLLSKKLNEYLGFEEIRAEDDRVYLTVGGVELLKNLARFANKHV